MEPKNIKSLQDMKLMIEELYDRVCAIEGFYPVSLNTTKSLLSDIIGKVKPKKKEK